MRKMLTAGTVALVLSFSMALPAAADEKHHHEGKTMMEGMKHEEGGMNMDHKKVACSAPVHLTEAAEKKMGGAMYHGPLPMAAKQKAGRKMDAKQFTNMVMTDMQMKEMKGAHNVHKGVRGGEFIMVPNHLHHMEIVYSLECGFQLFMYNAFTEPIRVDRFQAFILILPESGDDSFEMMRFLVPSKDGGVMQTPIAHDDDSQKAPKGLFEVELYIKFPEDIQPRKFDLVVGSEAG